MFQKGILRLQYLTQRVLSDPFLNKYPFVSGLTFSIGISTFVLIGGLFFTSLSPLQVGLTSSLLLLMVVFVTLMCTGFVNKGRKHIAMEIMKSAFHESLLPQMILDHQGNCLFANLAFLKLFKGGTARFNLGALIHPAQREAFKLSLHKVSSELLTSLTLKGMEPLKVQCYFSQMPFDPSLVHCVLINSHAQQVQFSSGTISVDLIEKAFENAPNGVVILDSRFRVVIYNTPLSQMCGGMVKNGIHFCELIQPEDQTEIINTIKAICKGGIESNKFKVCFKGKKQDSVQGYVQSLGSNHIALRFFDREEQNKYQLRLLQSQKLHAMGELAGGIAHDFNNLLTAMIGFCDLLLVRHSPSDQSFTDIMQIKQNANRAANLVRQLLAFSRQQTLQPRVIDVTENLAELSILLQRLIGASNELHLVHGNKLGLIYADQGQLEQVIINLVVNARDAMPGGGTIRIKTSNKTLDYPLSHASEIVPRGTYVFFEVSDTGTGIETKALPRIFDPFFSTKESGAGTGLGLSTVYGILKQMGGYILVDTTLEKGTTFSIYLPVYEEKKQTVPKLVTKKKEPTSVDLTGSGSILLVEDENAVRLFTARTLRDRGYHVMEAQNGEEGFAIIKSALENNEKIDLLITDVVMPQMDGPTLVREVIKIHPTIKVLFISGYAESSFRDEISQSHHNHFLAKPYSLKDLALKVREVIDAKIGREHSGPVVQSYDREAS